MHLSEESKSANRSQSRSTHLRSTDRGRRDSVKGAGSVDKFLNKKQISLGDLGQTLSILKSSKKSEDARNFESKGSGDALREGYFSVEQKPRRVDCDNTDGLTEALENFRSLKERTSERSLRVIGEETVDPEMVIQPIVAVEPESPARELNQNLNLEG